MKGIRESSLLLTEQVVEKADEGDKEKKKNRRQRRARQNQGASASLVIHSGFSSAEGTCVQTSKRLENGSGLNDATLSIQSLAGKCEEDAGASNEQVGLFASQDPCNSYSTLTKFPNNGVARASVVSFASLPTMHIQGEVAAAEWGSMQDRNFCGESSRSCPEPFSYEGTSTSFPNKECLPCQKTGGCFDMMQRKCFVPHLSVQEVNVALMAGKAFRASFRVNAHNLLEAYCTLDGVPTDVLISGVAAQNRAIHGDTVAVMLDPVACWAKLKGSASRFSNSVNNNSNMVPDVTISLGENCKGKEKMVSDHEYPVFKNGFLRSDRDFDSKKAVADEAVMGVEPFLSHEQHLSVLDPLELGYVYEQYEAASALEKLCAIVKSHPSKRPTGRVAAIIERSPRRDAVIGFLGVKQWLSYREGNKEINGQFSKKYKNPMSISEREYIQLTPTDGKFLKMMVSVSSLPDGIKEKLHKGDWTVETELVAARIDDWTEESYLPQARVMHSLGRGGDIEAQIAAILFENAIYNPDFPPSSLACLPKIPWKLPVTELERRKDLRNLCMFTIDPPTATDLDDALSIEMVSDGVFRVGVHIADISYFVLPDTALDKEALIRSTNVYLKQHKLPMLPPSLSEGLCSLAPGVDRLAFSIVWDINLAGEIINHWIGHTVIRSCCKLSYQHAQDIIDGNLDLESGSTRGTGWPQLHGQFEWQDVIESVKSLSGISQRLKENRFKDGALWLESSKLVFLFDEYGMPCDGVLCERNDANFLVEELMLLANRTAASVISRAFPDCALLRRHPEPNLRKLKEFEVFCSRHGFELDASSAGQLHHSLLKIREKLKDDPVLFDVFVSYASKPMQLAAYFCTGDLRDRENDWVHYSLAIPFYTHFTSPLRRYPDIVVHRTLAAALDAEEMYLKRTGGFSNETAKRCFTGLDFDKDASESKEGKEVLSAAAMKHRVPRTGELSEVASYCNARKLASRHAEEAGNKLCLWALLKKKEPLISDARVLGLGPKFMSIYIYKLAMERRIYYNEVEGLIVEWLESASALVLDFRPNKRFQKRGSPGKFRTLDDVALVVNPVNLYSEQEGFKETSHEVEMGQIRDTNLAVGDRGTNSKPKISDENETEPAVFPLTLRLLSPVPVAVHAIGGDSGPLDIGARLYLSSYFR